MKTAEELIKEYDGRDVYGQTLYTEKMCKHAMIEFAQQHVQEALKAAAAKAVVEIVDHEYGFRQLPEPIYGVNSESIEESYPLENIK